MENKKTLKVGDQVIFIDSHYTKHRALVTNVWPSIGGDIHDGANLVYVDDDETKKDPYGRQIARATSVVHKSLNAAGAYCWMQVEEDVDG